LPKRPGSPPLDAIHKTEHRWIEGSETAGLGRLLASVLPIRIPAAPPHERACGQAGGATGDPRSTGRQATSDPGPLAGEPSSRAAKPNPYRRHHRQVASLPPPISSWAGEQILALRLYLRLNPQDCQNSSYVSWLLISSSTHELIKWTFALAREGC